MDTRDSGVIDLFAIHKEEERRVSEAPPSTGALPAVSFDTHHTPGGDADIDALAFAQQKSRKRAKIVGGAIGGLAVIGILIAAIATGGSKEPAKDATAAAAPPPAVTETLPAPAAAPPPADTTPKSEPAPPSTGKSADAAYSRKDAIAAAKKTSKAAKAGSAKSGIKMQKIQSSGTN